MDASNVGEKGVFCLSVVVILAFRGWKADSVLPQIEAYLERSNSKTGSSALLGGLASSPEVILVQLGL